MDGRVQLPVIRFLQNRFNTEYVDSITEPGPNLILSECKNQEMVNSIIKRINISIEKHNSTAIAVVGHYDCAGNPATKDKQIEHIKDSIKLLRAHFNTPEIIGLWVDESWKVNEIL
jgi:hypothetical protein